MRDIRLICVGKLKEKFYQDACAEYQKRLSSYCKLTVTELPEEKLPSAPSAAQISAALCREAAGIRARIPPYSHVAALCIEGRLCTSEEFSRMIQGLDSSRDRRMAFLIGGSYGLDGDLKTRAQQRISMSPMTFPHHLARVMLLEQIYRAFKILEGSSYHK